jgi:hypothetical protein
VAAGYCSEAPSPPRFVSRNFEGSESGHIQSVKVL